MKFIAFNGSPSGKDSATNKILTAFMDGAKQAGAETEIVHLTDCEIKQCRGCFACWFQTPGKCVMVDDMKELLQKYIEADIVCFGSPVFSWNMTGLLKNFVDRLVPLKSPLIKENAGNFDMADTKKRQQEYVAVSNCGFPGDNNFDIIKSSFSICNPTLEIYRNCGKLLKSKQKSVQPIVEKYLSAVKRAGFEMAQNGDVSSDTRASLDMPLMTAAEYVKFLGM